MSNRHESINREEERAFINAFVSRLRRRRYAELITTPRGRRKLVADLPHFAPSFDTRFVKKIEDRYQNPLDIGAVLNRLGAPPECLVISEDRRIDGKRMPLADALSMTVGEGFGCVLSCTPGILAYFEGEEANDRLILHRDDLRRTPINRQHGDT